MKEFLIVTQNSPIPTIPNPQHFRSITLKPAGQKPTGNSSASKSHSFYLFKKLQRLHHEKFNFHCFWTFWTENLSKNHTGCVLYIQDSMHQSNKCHGDEWEHNGTLAFSDFFGSKVLLFFFLHFTCFKDTAEKMSA